MCGATPLTIAVVKKNEELSELLIQNFAMFDSRYFTTIPNPMTIAEKLDMKIVGTMKKMSDKGLADNYEIWRTFFVQSKPATPIHVRPTTLIQWIQLSKVKRTNTKGATNLA